MNVFRYILVVVLSLSIVSIMSGCMVPDDQLTAKLPAKDAVRQVQDVVDQYQQETGLLPIVTADEKIPVYEKYRINFEQLLRDNYMSSMPDAAFEKGGGYYFLIVNEDTKPQVRLMDITLFQTLNDIQRNVKTYMEKHKGKLPAGNEAYPGLFYVNFKLLNLKQPVTTSMFSGQIVEPMIDKNGTVYADYALDIMQAMQKSSLDTSKMTDVREVLVQTSDFVPVKSLAYRLVNGEPSPVLP